MTRKEFDKLYLGKAVHCPTEELAKEFLKLADSAGYNTKGISYRLYKEETCFRIHDDANDILYGDLGYYKACGYEIIEFKSMKPSLKDMILQELGVEIGEKIKLDIRNGATYRVNENLFVEVLYPEQNGWVRSTVYNLQDLILKNVKIIKIAKPLLTPEELEVLKNYEFETLETDGDYLTLCKSDNEACEYIDSIRLAYFKHKFEGLELNKNYTRKELGL